MMYNIIICSTHYMNVHSHAADISLRVVGRSVQRQLLTIENWTPLPPLKGGGRGGDGGSPMHRALKKEAVIHWAF